MKKHKHMRKVFSLVIITTMIILSPMNNISLAQVTMSNQNVLVSKDVRVKLDGHLLNFDVNPMIINNRTLVPFRRILEALGSEVGWNGLTRTVTATKDSLNIKLKIDSKDAFINEEKTELDVPATIVNGRTLIPARFISEALGCEVGWDNTTRTVMISRSKIDMKNSNNEFIVQGITIGDPATKVINTLGEPSRKDSSKYGFKWYIYNDDYSKYIQVGISDEKVVGIYTNAVGWESKKGVKTGITQSVVQNTYGESLTGITKGNTIYKLDNTQSDTYLIDDYYTTIFYDLYRESTVTAVLLIKKETEEALDSYFGGKSDELKVSFERQILDLANAVRVKNKKEDFEWDDEISKVAREHSKDMAQNNYFSHVNLEGESPFKRMEDEDIKYVMAAENIAAGQPSAIFAHEGWMNSMGHRKNILGDCKRLGVGVSFGGTYKVYYTQNFFTPKN